MSCHCRRARSLRIAHLLMTVAHSIVSLAGRLHKSPRNFFRDTIRRQNSVNACRLCSKEKHVELIDIDFRFLALISSVEPKDATIKELPAIVAIVNNPTAADPGSSSDDGIPWWGSGRSILVGAACRLLGLDELVRPRHRIEYGHLRWISTWYS